MNVFDQSEAAAEYVRAYQNFEIEVEQCMNKQGFEFINIDRELGAGSLFPEEYQTDLLAGINDRNFAEKYGFGITPLVLMDLARTRGVDGEMSDEQVVLEDALDEKLPDQNTPEGAAYYAALYGGEDGDGPGCEAAAREQWLGGAITANLAIQDVRQAQRQFADDIRVEMHYEDWARCMDRGGFSYRSPIEAYLRFDEQLESQYGDLESQGEKLAEMEREVAIAAVDCGASSRGLLPVELRSVWTEYVDDDWAN